MNTFAHQHGPIQLKGEKKKKKKKKHATTSSMWTTCFIYIVYIDAFCSSRAPAITSAI